MSLEHTQKCKIVWNRLKQTGTVGLGFGNTFTKGVYAEDVVQ